MAREIFTETLQYRENIGKTSSLLRSTRIFCHVKATFGRSGRPLPFSEIEMPETLEKFKYLARLLLNGEIFEKLDEFKKNLLSSPNTMVKSWSKLVPRTESLASALKNRQVCWKKKLVVEWKVDKKCNFQICWTNT
jgi:ATP-dependent RNA helicase DHX37/DHR1